MFVRVHHVGTLDRFYAHRGQSREGRGFIIFSATFALERFEAFALVVQNADAFRKGETSEGNALVDGDYLRPLRVTSMLSGAFGIFRVLANSESFGMAFVYEIMIMDPL